MVKILFVCHGNICRSPMGEYVLKDMVKKRGLADRFEIDSAAVSREEIGNPVYPPAQRELAKHGIRCDGHAAHQITRQELETYDHIYYMDQHTSAFQQVLQSAVLFLEPSLHMSFYFYLRLDSHVRKMFSLPLVFIFLNFKAKVLFKPVSQYMPVTELS